MYCATTPRALFNRFSRTHKNENVYAPDSSDSNISALWIGDERLEQLKQ